MTRGPYRKQGRKYEAIIEGIHVIAGHDARLGRPSKALGYKREDYRQAYAEGYVAALNSAKAADHV